MMENKQGRIRYLDISKAIAIFLVVFGHVAEVSQHPADQVLHRCIYAFHMPFFFFVSGYSYGISKRSEKNDFLHFLGKKLFTIYMPYLLWGLIFASVGIWKKIPLLLWGSYDKISESGTVTPLWYLPCFLAASIIYYCIDRLCVTRHHTIKMAIAGGLLFLVGAWTAKFGGRLPFNINVALMGCAFMCFGCSVAPYFNRYIVSHHWLFLFFSLAGCMLFLFNVPEASGYINMAIAEYGNPVLFLITALFGTMFLLATGISLERLLKADGKCSRLLCYVGRNTLIVLCVHKSFVWLLPKFKKVFEMANVAATLGFSIVILFVSLLINCLICPFCPALVGKTSMDKGSFFNQMRNRIKDRRCQKGESKETHY